MPKQNLCTSYGRDGSLAGRTSGQQRASWLRATQGNKVAQNCNSRLVLAEQKGLVWMAENEVVVRAGIPGMQDPEDNGEHRYPAGMSDFVKLLREQGFVVSYEHKKSERTLVSYKAFEILLPILDFTASVSANVAANIVSTLIKDYFKARRQDVEDAILHVKYLTSDQEGNVAEFEANGRGADVLKSMEKFDPDAGK